MTEKNAARELIEALNERKWHIALAESCTGGLLAATLTEVSGASQVFELGMVSYSECIKEKMLGVKAETLTRHTVYSKETAIEMAQGVLRLADANLALAVTGLAGPGGGTATKPVGLVYVAAVGGDRLAAREFRFSGDRAAVRRQTVTAALEMALAFLRETPLAEIPKRKAGESKS